MEHFAWSLSGIEHKMESLLEVRRRLASEKAALQPRLERSNSLDIALKSVELDL